MPLVSFATPFYPVRNNRYARLEALLWLAPNKFPQTILQIFPRRACAERAIIIHFIDKEQRQHLDLSLVVISFFANARQ